MLLAIVPLTNVRMMCVDHLHEFTEAAKTLSQVLKKFPGRPDEPAIKADLEAARRRRGG